MTTEMETKPLPNIALDAWKLFCVSIQGPIQEIAAHMQEVDGFTKDDGWVITLNMDGTGSASRPKPVTTEASA